MRMPAIGMRQHRASSPVFAKWPCKRVAARTECPADADGCCKRPGGEVPWKLRQQPVAGWAKHHRSPGTSSWRHGQGIRKCATENRKMRGAMPRNPRQKTERQQRNSVKDAAEGCVPYPRETTAGSLINGNCIYKR